MVPEWQYLLPKFGCSLKDLVTESNEAEYLAMIVELVNMNIIQQHL
jgi:hypothetical protein